MSVKPISDLRRRMLQDMTNRSFGDKTKHDFIRHVEALARFLDRSPDTATADDVPRFQASQISAAWGTVDGQVQTVEQNKTLTYTWDTKDLRSVVTWTLTPTSTGTHLRMEQSGFRTDKHPYYRGAKVGWPQFLPTLEQVWRGWIKSRRRHSKICPCHQGTL